MINRDCLAVLITAATVWVSGCATRPNPDACLSDPGVCVAPSSCDLALGICVAPDADVSGTPDADASATPDPTDGGEPVSHPDPAPVQPITISFVSPASSPTYTNGSVLIEVALSGPAPDVVELLDGANVIATLSGTSEYFWDTSNLNEGEHHLSARATLGSQKAAAGALIVVVDRTAPATVARTPLHDDQDVSLYEPIEIQFSEPVVPVVPPTAGAPGASVALFTEQGPVAATTEVVADGKGLRVQITHRAAIALPATVFATVPELADRAGNPIAPISWTWHYPVWLDLGSPVAGRHPSIGLAPGAAPVVVATVPSEGNGNWQPVLARHLKGKQWSSIASPPGARQSAAKVALAVMPNGDPILGWAAAMPGASARTVQVARFTGSGWDTRYGQLDAAMGNTSADTPSLAVDHAGRLSVAWQEPTSPDWGAEYGIYGAVWSETGSSWDLSGPVAIGNAPSVRLDPMGQPVIGWTRGATWGVTRLQNASWVTIPTPNVRQALAVDSRGVVVVAWVDAKILHVQRFENGIGQDYVAPLAMPDFYVDLQLALDAADRPVVAWVTADAMARIGIARWTGAQWEADLRFDAPRAAAPSLALDSHGRPVIAWSTQPGGIENERINVAQSNR